MKNQRNHARHHVSLIRALLVLIGVAILVPGPAAFAAINSAPIWSAPVNLGPAINSAASDQQPAISPDGLSLYFTSNRTGGLGGFDMYVSHRASISDPWGSQVNLGPSLNTTADEGNAAFSRDGRLLFFQSKRLPSLGGIDIWVAQRNNTHDDFDWQPAVSLGPAVNSAADDNGPGYFEDIARGTRQLYFGSTRSGGPGAADIYVSEQMADGSFKPAILVTELSSASTENDPSIRHDGLEILFQSNRAGSSGTSDLWVATRVSTLDPWSAPVNLVDSINTASAEQNAYLSSDGMTLFFSSDRPSGFGGLDLYMSARTLPSPVWSITGNLNTGRQFHTATLLPNGKILVAGGTDSNRSFKSAELYDPATGTWNRTADLNTDRNSHTATLLQNGKVLVAGGFSCGPPPQICSGLNSAELFEPATGTWTVTGNLNRVHDGHTATLLPNGKVLVVSGDENRNSAELYDPNTGTWSDTGNLNQGRGGHTATLLTNGKVLVAGGESVSGNPLKSAELYDPVTETWSNTGSLNTAREFHAATLLSNGRVLVASGFVNFTGQTTTSAELYDPVTGIWSTTGNLNQGRAFHTATLLTSGKVLVAGGFFVDGLPNTTNTAESYDPATGTWGNTATLNVARRFHTANLLLSGKVLVTGGTLASSTAELYDPGTAAQPAAPANDDFANAQAISGSSGSVTGSNVGATAEPDEPQHAKPGGKSVWYRWQASSTGIAKFDTGGSDFDTLLAVYTGSDVSSDALTPIASNDDRNTAWYPSAASPGAMSLKPVPAKDGLEILADSTSVVTFNAEAGTVYNIAVDGSAGASGHIRLNWNFCSPASAPTPIPRSVTLSFAELPLQPANGLNYGGVTFGFKVNGSDSTNAQYNSAGPGTQTFVQDPSLEGDAAGTLTLNFAEPTSVLRFGVALSTQSSLTPGFTVQLFDASANSLGTLPVNTSSCSASFPSQSLFDYSGLAVSRAVITFNSVAGRFALDNLSFIAPNPIDNARNFARQHYLDFLNREPDQLGWDYWTSQITQCGADAICIRKKRVDVSNAFFFELEYQQTGAYVFRLYREAYGNNQPLSNGNNKLPSYAVFAPDRALVVAGANLAQAQLGLANAFVGRPEFLAKYPASLSGPDFVDAELATIKNDSGADLASQRNALINLFNSGGRGAVLYRLADDNLQSNPINNRALIDAEYNRAFVATQYFGYLRRDSDSGGFEFWLNQVNRFPIRDVAIQHAMVCAFITSIEYQLRFGLVATRSNADCAQ